MSTATIKQDLLQAAVEALPADELAPVRRAAVARFADMGFPTVGQEDWKYTSLADAADISNEWLNELVGAPVAQVGTEAEDVIAAVQAAIDAHWIVVTDGVVDGEFLEPGPATGVAFSRITADNSEQFADDDAMSVFNASLLRDGLRITIAGNAAPEKPVGILYLDAPSNAVVQTRVIIDAGENSHLKLVECSLSAASGRQFTNAVLQVSLARGARIDHVRIQDRDREHVGVNRIDATLSQEAEFHHNSFDLGGAMTRNDVTSRIEGSGASVSLNGLYLASGNQHIDNHTSILHGVGPAQSVEEYRGILAGRSQCVFNGKVVVSEGADGTDSSQSNYNLLLSDRAEIDTKPELEIYADDVKCAHGATVGQLDESALFYLRSRGLDIDQARQVLTRAFAAGTLGALAVEECHDYLAGLLDRRLESLVGEQR